ncbi:MAG TPA: FGGY-family carbohydrate kinase, partial [Chitinophagaceae bacterium]|nr:FGGY-family carbohydrate kinase [Chitinophagaceae bacterium]
NVVQWLIKNFLLVDSGEDPYQRLFTQIESVSPGSDGLLFLPYLHGERAPIWDEKSTGVFFGIRSSHTNAHFIRAGLEGICFALNHILSILETEEKISEIRFSGGLATSEIMLQLLADITGKRVIRQQEEDASSIGAAYLGLRSTGLMKNYSLLSQTEISVIHPRKENEGNYGRLFSMYAELYDSLKGHMHRLSLFDTGNR